MKLNLGPICALLLATPISNVLAKNLLEEQLFRRGLDVSVADAALEIVERALSQEKRDIQPDDSGVDVASKADDAGAAAASKFSEAAFNATAVKACDSALGAMKSAVNPSGIVACYNIPFYDNKTGVFQTDLRLYQMNQPVDEFAGTKPNQYSLSVTIPEATLSSPKSLISGGPVQVKTSNGQTVKMLQGFTSVGQLNDILSPEKLTVDDLRVLMIPNITMSANDPVTSNLVSTTLSSDTISYVAGQLMQPNGTPTNITFPESKTRTTAILASATKFSYPGTTIRVNPIGGIITGIWCGLFIGIVGLGTIGRYRFRQAYRQRAARAMAGAVPKGF
ncbi:predicted protein [Paecilomyces variotii No. 5]|uniref:Uncharacterized protein n=1 Tax=Byssochlamys spectabilis (strain No. 5 / NBRC 109023) TaxID=1356009 RepID=V5FHT5_BYSSN|nr:predicted protein [Paecilomyces variotii No. 5]